MTGHSWNKKYWKKMISCLLFLSGAFLLIEHVYNFGGMDLEIIGHEYLGLLFIIIGFLLSLKWGQISEVRKAWKDRNLRKLLDEGERK